VAFKVNDQHSLGFGLMVQHTEAELKKDLDLSLLVNNPNAAGTGKLDANIDIKGSDWGVGFNAGWMWNPSRDWQLGLSYRSYIKHKLSGKAKTTLPESLQGIPPITASLPAEQNASVDITTPESISAHAMHQLDPRWKLFGDVTWTRHSRFEELNIKFEGTGEEQIIPSRWKNTFKFALGAAYKWSDPLELRFGVAYDQSPSKDAKYRLTTLPDNDRTWLSLGGKYQFNKNLSMNAAYSYIMIKNSDINHSGPGLTTAKANYKNSAQYLGMQLNYRF
jgi:long-chain fatty acid transport protein